MHLLRSLHVVVIMTALAGGVAGQPADPHAASFDVQGHRGARGLLPENTIAGFLRALDLGVTTLEMDAVVTRDGEVVLSHEPWFSAAICSLPSGEPVPEARERSYRIYGMTYAEVARFDCGRRGHPSFPRQDPRPAAKPLLRDVIAAAEAYAAERGLPPVRYNIETKSRPGWEGTYHPEPERFVRLVHDVVDAAGVRARTTLQSFDVRTLQAARRGHPSWRLSLLVDRGGDRGVAANVGALGFTPEVYSPDYRLVDERLLETAHRMGMEVIPWTVNEADDMRRLKALGVDGLITDYPDVARDTL